MKILLRLFIILFTSSMACQTIPELQKIKGPEAAALQKAIDVPVSMYSGTLGLSIPLYEISINGANVPITLNYSGGGGIKVDEDASMVGLGWTLSYGGSVSRTLKNKPDEWSFFGKQTLADFFSFPTYAQDPAQVDACWYMRDIKRSAGVDDLSADEFNYSAGGYSGQFIYKQSTSSFVIYPKEDVSINYTYDPIAYRIRKWDVVLPDGTKHTFGEGAVSRTTPVSLSPPPADSGVVEYSVDNMWALKKITTIYGDSIVYNYGPNGYTSYSRSTNESCSNKNGAIQTITSRSATTIDELIIQSIVFKGGTVSFTNSNRIDGPARKIDEIVVTNSSGQVVRKVKLYYSYFNGTYGIVPAFYRLNTTDDIENKRLKLDSISITGSDNVNVEKYKFTYYDNNGVLPSKYSFAQDLWGYFNGRNNTTFVPKLTYWVTNGADRKVNNAVNNVFMLKSITYPTGGKSEFTYEGNVVKRGAFSEFNSMLNDDPYNDSTETLLLGNATPVVMGNEKYYYKNFTVPANGGYPHPQGWSCSFGANISNLTVSSDCSFNYAWFKLEKQNASTNAWESIQAYKYCYNTTPPVDSEGMVSLYPGNYRLVIITMFPTLPSNTTALNGLTATIRWKNSYTSTSPEVNASLNIGGLRVQEVRNYSSDGVLETKKQYEYLDENGYSSGSMYEEPRHIQLHYIQNTSPIGEPETPNYGPNITVYGSPLMPLKPIAGSYVGYQFVTEKIINAKDSQIAPLKTRYTYTSRAPIYNSYTAPTVYLDGLVENHDWQFGKIKKVEYYKNGVTNPIKTEEYNYINNLNVDPNAGYADEILVDRISWRSLNIAGLASSDFTDNYLLEGHYGQLPPSSTIFAKRFIYGIKCSTLNIVTPSSQEAYYYSQMTLPYIKHYTGSDKLASKVTTTVDDLGNSLTQTETYTYSSTAHNQITSSETTNSLGEIVKQKFYYPKDYLSTPVYNQMDQKHMVSQVVKQESLLNNTVLSTFKTNYFNWGTFIAPSTIELQKATQTSEIRFTYNNYDAYGNIVSATPGNGPTSCYIYSYNNKYPVAEIQNASYSAVLSVLGGATAVSNFSNSNPTDAQVNSFLVPLRVSSSLANAMVTTFTYKPLVGITTVTDPKGYVLYYEYDVVGRLKSVKEKDSQGNYRILSESEYNYRPQ